MEYRGYLIQFNKALTLYYIATAGRGGKIPDIMLGNFTSVGICKTLIDNYLTNKKEVTVKNEAAT